MNKALIITSLCLLIFSMFSWVTQKVHASSPVPGPSGVGICTVADNPLTTSYTLSGNLDAIVVVVPYDYANNPSGVFVVSDIPPGATVAKALVYHQEWQYVSGTTASSTLAGHDLGYIPALTSDPGGGLHLAVYRWDVTSIVTGNGEYPFTTTGLTQVYGAALVVVYSSPDRPASEVIINDGAESMQHTTATTEFFGVGAGPGKLIIYTQACDPYDTGEMIAFNSDIVGGPIDANVGSYASLFTLPVTTVLGQNTASITTFEDWFGWHLAILVSAPGDTAPPIAHSSDIDGQPQVMYPDEPYTVTAKYFDPNGREDLKYCYLQLLHPDKPLTMMWYQADGHAAPWAGEEGEDYLTIVNVDADPITEGGLEGYQLAWTFTINDQWPEVENAIDFGVYAWDDSDLKSGWDYDDTKASFSHTGAYTHRIAYIPVTYKAFGAPTHTVQELKQRAAMVADYYEQQSYGKVKIDFEFIFNEWEELGKTLEEYNNLEFPEDEAAVAFDALQLAGVNTNEYDAIIVVEPYGEHQSAAWDEPYNMVLTTDRRTYATWAHELGHVIFKWDEYYGKYSEDSTMGRGDIEYWGLMGRATLMNPTAPIMSYNKVLAGWLTYHTILPEQYGTYPVKLLMELQRDDQVHRYQTKADATTKHYIFEGRHPPDGIQTDPWDDYKWGDYEYRLDEEKGVLLYRVYLKQGIEHVSAIPHVGALTWSDDETNRVTLTPGDTYPDDLAGVTFTAHENDSELSIEISGYTPLSRTVISLSELSWEVSGMSLLSEPFPSENRFDIDLHMYTYDGRKVGMDYATGEYLVQIEDARTSGNTPGGGPEWISIPQGTKIYFTIDPTPARKWGEERGLSITEIEAEIKAVFLDDEGERTETEPIRIPIYLDKPVKLTVEEGEIRLLAHVEVEPKTMNLRARGIWTTLYIELPEGFDVNDIDISTILLNGTVPALSWPTAIGDYNDNGIPDLMVKFNRWAVQEVLDVGKSVEITITGEVGAIPFMGTDTIRVIGR